VCHAERLGDLAQITLCTDPVPQCRRAADYFQVGHSGKASEDFILYTVRKVSILFLVA
jgi:hypothetical protein